MAFCPSWSRTWRGSDGAHVALEALASAPPAIPALRSTASPGALHRHPGLGWELYSKRAGAPSLAPSDSAPLHSSPAAAPSTRQCRPAGLHCPAGYPSQNGSPHSFPHRFLRHLPSSRPRHPSAFLSPSPAATPSRPPLSSPFSPSTPRVSPALLSLRAQSALAAPPG